MKLAKIFFVILLSVMSYSFAFGEEGKPTEPTLFQGFREIQGFWSIEGKNLQEENTGLSETELTDYVKLKFKNNFGGIQLLTRDQLEKIRDKRKYEKLGYIWFGVFIVGGSDFPVAYNVQCRVGNYKYFIENLPAAVQRSSIIWENQMLGIDTKINVPTRIKECINILMEKLAIDFFKARGEL